jgi:hypothetical protein
VIDHLLVGGRVVALARLRLVTAHVSWPSRSDECLVLSAVARVHFVAIAPGAEETVP